MNWTLDVLSRIYDVTAITTQPAPNILQANYPPDRKSENFDFVSLLGRFLHYYPEIYLCER